MSRTLRLSVLRCRCATVLAAGVLAALLMVASFTSPAAAQSVPQSGPTCSKFDSSLDGFGPCTDAPNVTVTRATDAGGLDPANPYMKLTDLSGQSRVCSTDPKYKGNWIEKMGGCGQLCYDFKVFNSGYPPVAITPSITILGSGGGRATYYAGFQIAVGDLTWHHICAPIEDGAAPPPGTSGGHWVVAGGQTWHQIITNVSMIQLPIDFTSNPSEVAGYDNICMTPGNCNPPPPPPPPPTKACLDAKGDVTCNQDGTASVVITTTNYSGSDITVTSMTPGVTVVTPQQAWAPTTTWKLSGATAGQTVRLSVTGTKAGGTIDGTDECCSTEITVVMPDCVKPPPTGEIIVLKKVEYAGPGSPPNLIFPVTVSCGNWNHTFNLVPGVQQSTGGAPLNVDCNVTEVQPPPPSGVCAAPTMPVWQPPSISPPTPFQLHGITTTVTITNTLECKQSGGDPVGSLTVTKHAVNNAFMGAPLPPGLVFPITVTCGSSQTNLSLTDGQSQTINNVPLNTSCHVEEGTPPSLSLSCPTQGQVPTWATEYQPSQDVTVTGPNTPVAVVNTVSCTGDGTEGGKGYLLVNKVVQTNSHLPLSAFSTMTFPVTATCGTIVRQLNLTLTGPQAVTGVPVGTTCTVAETGPLPPLPTSGSNCPSGTVPTWGTPIISPDTTQMTSGAGPAMHVTNPVECQPAPDGNKDTRTGQLMVQKVVESEGGAKVPAEAIYPVTFTCNRQAMTVNVANGQSVAVGTVPYGSSCAINEPTPPVPPGACPDGSTAIWSSVYPPTVTVNDPTVVVNVTNKLSCTPVKTPPVSCQAPQMPNKDGTGCDCPDGMSLRNGKCGQQIVCRAPLVPDAKGDECVCRAGTVRRGNSCVERIVCAEPAFPNRQGTACLCPKGMEKRGNSCVRREREGPRIRTEDVIRIAPGIIGGFGGGGSRGSGERGGGSSGGGYKPPK